MRVDLHVLFLSEVKVEKNPDDISNVDTKQNCEDKSVDCFTQRIAKRCASRGLDAISSEPSQSTGRKKAKVTLQVKEERYHSRTSVIITHTNDLEHFTAPCLCFLL